MLRIIMDGAGDMPLDWARDFDIKVIPINIHFGDKTFLQGVDLPNDDFYRLADQGTTIPKTSQPSPHQFVEFYQRIAKAGDTIISLHVTSKLSGTYNSAIMAARELKERFRILPFDSATGSAALGFMCKEARLLERAGASIEVIMERMEFIRRNVSVVLTLDTLEYARRSGRVKALQAALASIINIKPVVILREGVLEISEKVRTRQRSINRIVEIVRQRVDDRLVNAAVVHAQAPEIGRQLMEMVRQALNCQELVMTELSIGVAANLGPGTVGVVAYPVKEG